MQTSVVCFFKSMEEQHTHCAIFEGGEIIKMIISACSTKWAKLQTHKIYP